MSEYFIYDPFNLINSICFEKNHEIIKNPLVSYNKDNIDVSFRRADHTTSRYTVPYSNIQTSRNGITNPKGIICFLGDITSADYINNVLLYLLEGIEEKISLLIHIKSIAVDYLLIDLPKSYKDKIEFLSINYEIKLNELYLKIPYNSYEVSTFPLYIVADSDEKSEESEEKLVEESIDSSLDSSIDSYESEDDLSRPAIYDYEFDDIETKDYESEEDEFDEDLSKIAIYNVEDINHESFKDVIIQDNNYAYLIGKDSKIIYRINKNNKCCEDTTTLLVLFPEYTGPEFYPSDSDKLISIARKFKNIRKFILCYGKFSSTYNLSFQEDKLLNIKSLHFLGNGKNLTKIIISDLPNLKYVDFDMINTVFLTGQFVHIPKLTKKLFHMGKLTGIEIIR